jgi:rod shape-determining protein MreD
MSEFSPTRIWTMRACFALLVCMILFFHLLPLDMTPGVWVAPDLLLAFALAWSVRRPEFVPMPVLAAVFFLADLLLQRPPGLWAFLALLACEQVKARARSTRESAFVGEWVAAAMAIIAVSIGYRLVLAITLVPLPSFGLAVIQVVVTLLCYPLVAGLTQYGLGVRRPAPSEIDNIGGRL